MPVLGRDRREPVAFLRHLVAPEAPRLPGLAEQPPILAGQYLLQALLVAHPPPAASAAAVRALR